MSCSRSLSVSLLALSRQKSSFLCVGDHVKCPLASSDLYSSNVLSFVRVAKEEERNKGARRFSRRRATQIRGCKEGSRAAHVMPSKLDLSSLAKKSTSSLISSSLNILPCIDCWIHGSTLATNMGARFCFGARVTRFRNVERTTRRIFSLIACLARSSRSGIRLYRL